MLSSSCAKRRSDMEDRDNQTSIVPSKMSGERSMPTEDTEEIKPISLADIDKSIENPRLDAELIRKLSYDHEDKTDLDHSNEISTKDCQDDGDSIEQNWTRKISVVNTSSGNLVEDLDCEDSSASSVTTIIDSQQTSTNVEDDLEDTFQSEDNMDPLHSRCFVVFGDDCNQEGRNSDKDNANHKEVAADTKATRVKTSNINPMTGKKSLTDDMQEWRENVLSSWTLTPPKKKKKYNRPKTKRPTMKRTYFLRRKNSIFEPIGQNQIVKNCRLLQNIASYNSPGVTKESSTPRVVSPNSTASIDGVKLKPGMSSGTKTRDNHCLRKDNRESPPPRPSTTKPNDFTIRIRIANEIFVPEDGMEDALQVPSRFVVFVRKRSQYFSLRRPNLSRKARKKMTRTKVKRGSEKHNSRSTKPTPRRSKTKDEPLDAERISIGSTRIAKRFIFNPTRKEGGDKKKIFFGTITGKRTIDDNLGPSFVVWQIVYDDEDEEEFDIKDLKKGLNLYEHNKHRDNKQSPTRTIKRTPNDKRCTVKEVKSRQNLSSELNQPVQRRSAKLHQSLPNQNSEYRHPRDKKRRANFSLRRAKKATTNPKQRQSQRLDVLSPVVDSKERKRDGRTGVPDVVDLTTDIENIGNNTQDVIDLTVDS